MPDQTKQEPNPRKEAMFVVLAGGVGGIMAYISSYALGHPLIGGWTALPSSIILGMGAGFLGVYLLAGSDTRALNRCLALAMICGFSWKPVWEAGMAYAEQSIDFKKESSASTEADLLTKNADVVLHSPATPEAIQTNAAKAVGLLSSLSAIKNPEIRAKAHLAVNRFLDAVNITPSTNYVAKVEAIHAIGDKAADVSEVNVADRSLITLRMLQVPSNSPAFHLKTNGIANIARKPLLRLHD